MISEGVLRVALAVLAVLLAAGIAAMLLHAVWLRRYRVRSERRLARGRAALNALLIDDRVGEAELAVLRSLPGGTRARVVLELSRSLGGSARERLAEVAERIGVVATARARLRSRFWWRRLHGARVLATLVGSERLFTSLLDDPHPAVQAQAAEWAGEHPSLQAARALLDHLPGASPMTRFAVQDSLLRMGTLVVEPLARYLADHAGDSVLPALRVACWRAQADYAAPARALCADAHPAVRARAAELLGATGGEAGVATLIGLLDDPDAAVRAAATHALGRLGHWPAAARLAERLRDASWDVRQAAGLALRALGSPGELMLRRFRTDPDRFAADMARRILELPGAERSG